MCIKRSKIRTTYTSVKYLIVPCLLYLNQKILSFVRRMLLKIRIIRMWRVFFFTT